MISVKKCIFCSIIRGEAPAAVVYEDTLTMAFMDIRPASDGHTLVVCREHFANLLDIDETALTAVMLATQRVARAIQRTLAPDGLRVSQFNGAAAGQTVFHYHTHIIPIRQGEKPDAHGRSPGQVEVIQRIAGDLRTALQQLT